MSRLTSDDQLNFLIKCVKHSTSGKVDFTAVAEECGIVSKGAAAKRYERLLKANDTGANGGGLAGGDDESPTKATPAATPKKTPKKTAAKANGGGANKSDTPKKRKGGKAAATTPTKKFKSEEKVEDTDSDNGKGTGSDEQDIVKKEEHMRGNGDPFLPQPPAGNGEDTLLNEFYNTAEDVKQKQAAYETDEDEV